MSGFRTPDSLPFPSLLIARSAEFPELFSLTCFALTSARLCTCLFMPGQAIEGLCFVWLICAERDVRVRVRWRVVGVHVQRRQVRVVSVVATNKAANGPSSAAALSFLKELNLTTGGYYPSLAPFGRWPGFLISEVAPLPLVTIYRHT